MLSKLEVSQEDKEILDKQTRIALRHCGVIDPMKIEDYIEDQGYGALEKS